MQIGWDCLLYILRGHRSEFPNYDVFKFMKIILSQQKVLVEYNEDKDKMVQLWDNETIFYREDGVIVNCY